MARLRARVLLVAMSVAALAGCAAPPGPPADPPDGEAPPFVAPTRADYPRGAPASCPTAAAQGWSLNLTAEAVGDPRREAPGALVLERDEAAPRRPRVVWVWDHVAPGERPDDVGRVTPVTAWRSLVTGDFELCARVDLVAPTNETPPADAPATLQIRYRPVEDLPPGNYTLVVNWAVGCPTCAGTPQGNASTRFLVP